MKVVDLFAGMKGWSQPFIDYGHQVFTIDFDERFDVDLHTDIGFMDPGDIPWQPDVVLASPPCEGFSVMNIGKNWYRDNRPKTDVARMGYFLVAKTRWLIEEWQPKYFVIENPRDKLRKLDVVADLERRTVTYCQYGEERMKPTDLWGGFPPGLILAEACKNGDPCHVRAPRGSSTGTQGKMTYAQKSKIPYDLANQFRLVLEEAL